MWMEERVVRCCHHSWPPLTARMTCARLCAEHNSVISKLFTEICVTIIIIISISQGRRLWFEVAQLVRKGAELQPRSIRFRSPCCGHRNTQPLNVGVVGAWSERKVSPPRQHPLSAQGGRIEKGDHRLSPWALRAESRVPSSNSLTYTLPSSDHSWVPHSVWEMAFPGEHREGRGERRTVGKVKRCPCWEGIGPGRTRLNQQAGVRGCWFLQDTVRPRCPGVLTVRCGHRLRF